MDDAPCKYSIMYSYTVLVVEDSIISGGELRVVRVLVDSRVFDKAIRVRSSSVSRRRTFAAAAQQYVKRASAPTRQLRVHDRTALQHPSAVSHPPAYIAIDCPRRSRAPLRSAHLTIPASRHAELLPELLVVR